MGQENELITIRNKHTGEYKEVRERVFAQFSISADGTRGDGWVIDNGQEQVDGKAEKISNFLAELEAKTLEVKKNIIADVPDKPIEIEEVNKVIPKQATNGKRKSTTTAKKPKGRK